MVEELFRGVVRVDDFLEVLVPFAFLLHLRLEEIRVVHTLLGSRVLILVSHVGHCGTKTRERRGVRQSMAAAMAAMIRPQMGEGDTRCRPEERGKLTISSSVLHVLCVHVLSLKLLLLEFLIL